MCRVWTSGSLPHPAPRHGMGRGLLGTQRSLLLERKRKFRWDTSNFRDMVQHGRLVHVAKVLTRLNSGHFFIPRRAYARH
jgi:hypothetical protein